MRTVTRTEILLALCALFLFLLVAAHYFGWD